MGWISSNRRGKVHFLTLEVAVKMLGVSHGTWWLNRFKVRVSYQMCKINLCLSVIRQLLIFLFKR